MKKLLFMTTIDIVDDQLLPHWRSALPAGAELMQAVPDMLEIVPQGRPDVCRLQIACMKPEQILLEPWLDGRLLEKTATQLFPSSLPLRTPPLCARLLLIFYFIYMMCDVFYLMCCKFELLLFMLA